MISAFDNFYYIYVAVINWHLSLLLFSASDDDQSSCSGSGDEDEKEVSAKYNADELETAKDDEPTATMSSFEKIQARVCIEETNYRVSSVIAD